MLYELIWSEIFDEVKHFKNNVKGNPGRNFRKYLAVVVQISLFQSGNPVPRSHIQPV